MKKELINIVTQTTHNFDNELQLINMIASKLTNLGYNGVNVSSDKYIYLGLDNNIYALIKIIFVELSTDTINNIVRDINTAIDKKAKGRYFIFVCNQNNKDKLTNILKQLDESLYFVDIKDVRVFVIGSFKMKI